MLYQQQMERYTIMQSISEDDILSYIAKFPNDIDLTLKFVNKKRKSD